MDLVMLNRFVGARCKCNGAAADSTENCLCGAYPVGSTCERYQWTQVKMNDLFSRCSSLALASKLYAHCARFPFSFLRISTFFSERCFARFHNQFPTRWSIEWARIFVAAHLFMPNVACNKANKCQWTKKNYIQHSAIQIESTVSPSWMNGMACWLTEVKIHGPYWADWKKSCVLARMSLCVYSFNENYVHFFWIFLSGREINGVTMSIVDPLSCSFLFVGQVLLNIQIFRVRIIRGHGA